MAEALSAQEKEVVAAAVAGTENRISTARKDYNDAVKDYNTTIKSMPTSIVASMMGKEKKDYFEVSDKAKEAVPEVGF